MLSSIVRHFSDVLGLLGSVTSIFLTEAEYQVIAARLWASSFRGIAIVTAGSRGARALIGGHTIASVGASRASGQLEVSGAGDAFAGAFTACMSSGHSVQDALSNAAVVASLAVSGLGVTKLYPPGSVVL